MVNVEFIGQLVDSMYSAVLRLEDAMSKGNKDEANKLRAFIFDLHRQMKEIGGGKNA